MNLRQDPMKILQGRSNNVLPTEPVKNEAENENLVRANQPFTQLTLVSVSRSHFLRFQSSGFYVDHRLQLTAQNELQRLKIRNC